MKVAAVVLAAGKGTRMKSDLAKVLHIAAGRPLIAWVLDSLDGVEVDETVAVVGYQAEAVAAVLPDGVATAVQHEQHGTGHATQVGLAALDLASDDIVLVLLGDMPLISAATLRSVLFVHEQTGAAATLLSVVLDGDSSFGRVLRRDGRVCGIVEVRDATPEQLAGREMNTSVYAFNAAHLMNALEELAPDNDQGELYLTDVVAILVAAGHEVAAVVLPDPDEAHGVNTLAELAAVSDLLEQRAAGSAVGGGM
jgi:bifunctional UDP-N-acetylglucosamine pyrophosphorylase/glucosamine-1-phosphate N-acetyltransferase